MPSGACSCKVVDGNEIAASWPRNSLITVLCKGPAASGKGKGTRSVANPLRRADRETAKERSDCTNPLFSFVYATNSQSIKELEAFSYSFRGWPAINMISSSRTMIKKKEPPKDDSPNRRRSSAPISASLFRYYSASPNASVIRIDLLDLTIADAGITLDLDKDWHPDLYVKCDTKH